MNAQASCDSSYSPSESFELTALQFAVRRNSIEQVKYLVESGTELDTGPDPALHLALRKGHEDIALVLLDAGANFELKDSHGDQPIHIACALGLLEVVKVLCAFGCSVETPTNKGLYPLHLSAKNGHISVVRCLCAAGCNIEVRNYDNIRADVTALKYGHNDIAELLDRLRATGQRDHFARQLVPTSKPCLKLSLRLLGHCGVGKTSFVKSLGAGLFSSLFRRSSSLQSNKSRPSSPINTQIEMDVPTRQNSINFEPASSYNSTNGINVQNLDISNLGELVVWDFSGQETYFPVYHHFLWPSPYSVTAILFSLDFSPSIQVQQVCFWLNFLLARYPADLPTSEYGPIMLIGTHVDHTRAVKTQQGEWIHPDAQKTLETVKKLLPHAPNLMDVVVIMDTNVPASFAFKQIKSILVNVKQNCLEETIGCWTGLLETSLTWLGNLRDEFEQYPVVTRGKFSELLRSQVNLLASDEHIQDLLNQLHIMGEVYCIEYLIVLSVSWLGGQLLGELLSWNFISSTRSIGVYTVEDFQSCYTECDASNVLELLECLDLCVQCDVEGEIEYEFPVFIKTETLDGLWDPNDSGYTNISAIYGGLRLYTSSGVLHMLKSIFSHIQVHLRRNLYLLHSDTDRDLFQWSSGSKYCMDDLEGLISLEEDPSGIQFVEVKVRAPNQLQSESCFFFLDVIMRTIRRAVTKVCSGLILETHVMSPEELKLYSDDPYCYNPLTVNTAVMEAESVLDTILYNPNTNNHETISQLLMFDDMALASNIHWSCVLSLQELSPPVKLKLCGLLDPPEPHGRDWCLLALKLGLCPKKIAALASQHSSHTMRLLTTAECSIGALITHLQELDRQDAADVVLKSAPIFKVLECAQF